VEVPIVSASVVTSNLDPTMWEECYKTDLEMVGIRSLHFVAAKIQMEAVVATWKVAWLLEILPMASRVLDYSKNL
jgi:hypothetical protein